jgi:uncharacterized repeat protein (TIGR01451 family)
VTAATTTQVRHVRQAIARTPDGATSRPFRAWIKTGTRMMNSDGSTMVSAPAGRTSTRAALCWAVLMLAAASAGQAAGLGVHSEPAVPGVAGTGSGQFAFRIENDGVAAVSDVRLFVSAGVDARCDGATLGGRGFADGGTLSGGDHVRCIARQTAGSPRLRSYALLVSGVDGDGVSVMRHVSVAQPVGGPVSPDQGVVVVLGGAIHVDGNSNGLLEAGESVAYHYTLVNAGTVAVGGLSAIDLDGPVGCPLSALAVGQAMVCTRSHAVTAADQSAGLVINEVQALGVDANGLPVQASDLMLTQNLAGSAGVRVVKSPLLLNDADGSGFASVGDLVGYTFLVKNSNAQALSAVNLVEPDPTRIDTPIVCSATTIGGLAFAGNGTGALQASDTATCSAQYTVRAGDAAIGQALNLVQVQATAAIAGPVPATGASAVAVPGGGQLTVTKTASAGMVAAGGSLVYTVVVTNTGTLPVANVTVSDPLPAGIAAFSWTCAGAACPVAAGTGAINQAIASLPAGASVVYSIVATVTPAPPGSVLNVVTVTPTSAVQCAPANSPPPCQAQVPVGIIAPPPMIVPTGSPFGLALMAVLLAFAARAAVRSRVVGRGAPI